MTALCGLARLGYAHGDLSAYNLLVHGGRLVMIDMPQIVDVIANPRGAEFLTRDSATVARWFTARGVTGVTPAPADLPSWLLAEARLSWLARIRRLLLRPMRRLWLIARVKHPAATVGAAETSAR